MALAPSGWIKPSHNSLAAGLTGGFIGTPADMVNVRSVLSAPPGLLAPCMTVFGAVGSAGLLPTSLLAPWSVRQELWAQDGQSCSAFWGHHPALCDPQGERE